MITLEAFFKKDTAMKIPVATLSFSGKGKKVIIEALSPSVEVELTNLLESNISTPTQTRISPSNRKEWMLALPKANSMLYIFRTVETISNIIEEEDNGNEEKNDEDHDTEGEPEVGGADDGGGDDGGGDSSDGGTYDDSTDGGYFNHNG